MKDKLKKLLEAIKALAEIEELTDEQAEDLQVKMAQAEKLQTQIKALEMGDVDDADTDDDDDTDEPDEELTAESVKAIVSDALKAFAGEPKKAPKKVAPGQMKKAHLGDPDPESDFYTWLATGKAKIKAHTNHDAELPVMVSDSEGGMKHIKVKAALQEGADDEGGYLVPAGELGRIIEKRDEAALMPRLGAMQFTTDRDVYNIPTEGTALTKFTIVAEEGAITGAQEEPTFGQSAVTLYNFKKLR
jgi:HK97 family phage major capsid protein